MEPSPPATTDDNLLHSAPGKTIASDHKTLQRLRQSCPNCTRKIYRTRTEETIKTWLTPLRTSFPGNRSRSTLTNAPKGTSSFNFAPPGLLAEVVECILFPYEDQNGNSRSGDLMKLRFSTSTIRKIAAFVFGASLVHAGTIVYSVNESDLGLSGGIGINEATYSGTIETNGTLGALDSGNIIGYSLLLNNGAPKRSRSIRVTRPSPLPERQPPQRLACCNSITTRLTLAALVISRFWILPTGGDCFLPLPREVSRTAASSIPMRQHAGFDRI